MKNMSDITSPDSDLTRLVLLGSAAVRSLPLVVSVASNTWGRAGWRSLKV